MYRVCETTLLNADDVSLLGAIGYQLNAPTPHGFASNALDLPPGTFSKGMLQAARAQVNDFDVIPWLPDLKTNDLQDILQRLPEQLQTAADALRKEEVQCPSQLSRAIAPSLLPMPSPTPRRSSTLHGYFKRKVPATDASIQECEPIPKARCLMPMDTTLPTMRPVDAEPSVPSVLNANEGHILSAILMRRSPVHTADDPIETNEESPRAFTHVLAMPNECAYS
eukprot:3091439-Amphidinium_carterae.1